MKTSMSAKRLLSLFVALALIVVVLLTVQARIAASNVAPNPQAAVDQAVVRAPRYYPPSAAALAEQARLEFRRSEWNAGSRSSQPYYRSVVPSLGWQMAPTSDYAPVSRSFHTPPTSPDRHR